LRAIPCTVPCQGFHFPTFRASHHAFDLESAISLSRGCFVKKNWDNCGAWGRELSKKSSGVAFQSQETIRERAARSRLEALVMANAAPRCGARSKRTGKPCRAAAMPNGRCKVHRGKSTGPRTPEGLDRSRRANWKHGYYSREAKAERSRVRAAILALRYLHMLGQ
jgi:hypothetical protein